MRLLAKLAAVLVVPLILLVIALWLIEDWIRGRKIGGFS